MACCESCAVRDAAGLIWQDAGSNTYNAAPFIAAFEVRIGRPLEPKSRELLTTPLYGPYYVTKAVAFGDMALSLERYQQWGLAANAWEQASSYMWKQVNGGVDEEADVQDAPAPDSARAIGGADLANLFRYFKDQDRAGGPPPPEPPPPPARRGRIRLGAAGKPSVISGGLMLNPNVVIQVQPAAPAPWFATGRPAPGVVIARSSSSDAPLTRSQANAGTAFAVVGSVIVGAYLLKKN